MYLNDAFDAEIDARERAARPIPMGEAGRGTVFALGLAMLALGALIAFALGARAGLAGVALAGTVVLYDWLHKRTALGPVIMGACRLLSYVTAAFAAGGATGALWVGAAGLFCHVVGLTYAAKQEAYDRIGAAWPLAVMAVPVVIGAAMLEGAVAVLLLAAYVIWSGWALSLFYVAGMYLNDAFDAGIDARERAERPIPMGEVGRGTVFALGFAMLALGAGGARRSGAGRNGRAL